MQLVQLFIFSFFIS